MSFYIGQRVVCVDDRQRNGYGDEIMPVVNRSYTVRDHEVINGTYCIRLVEIVNTIRLYTHNGDIRPVEPAFSAATFRPLDTLDETMERIEKEGCPLELEHA
jgi:hypothetical protein